ncbi:MAG: hypothetical protein ACT4QG_08350 [Sporichthyaceae bacterium]
MPTAPAALGLAVLAASLATAPPASAGGGTRCTYEQEVRLDPGVSVQASRGTVQNHGGVIDCAGEFLGIRPTGPGRFVVTGDYGVADAATCLGGDVAGAIVFTFPTADGERSVRTPYSGRFGGLSDSPAEGPFGATVESRNWVVRAKLTPTRGDCLLNPVTRLRDVGVLTTR